MVTMSGRWIMMIVDGDEEPRWMMMITDDYHDEGAYDDDAWMMDADDQRMMSSDNG